MAMDFGLSAYDAEECGEIFALLPAAADSGGGLRGGLTPELPQWPAEDEPFREGSEQEKPGQLSGGLKRKPSGG